MNRILTIAGSLAIGIGLIWAAQGAGIFPYPAESFMINETRWIWIGLGIAASGLAAVVASKRL